MLGEHREILCREDARCAAARDGAHRDAGAFEELQGALEEDAGGRVAVGEGHETLEVKPGEPHGRQCQVERVVRRLDAVPAEARVAFDEERDVQTVGRAGLGEAARDHFVVEESHVHGTHSGPLFGIPPSNRHIEFDMVIYFPFKDDRIMGERLYLDVNSITGQVMG